MSENDNILVVDRVFEALNTHKLDGLDALSADDYIYEAPGAPGPLDGKYSKAYLQGFIDAFPDLHFDLPLKIAQGEYVVFHWVASGTHTGGLRTPTGAVIPPTGKKVTLPGSTTYQVRDGKTIHAWVHWDMTTMLAQLGLMPG